MVTEVTEPTATDRQPDLMVNGSLTDIHCKGVCKNKGLLYFKIIS